MEVQFVFVRDKKLAVEYILIFRSNYIDKYRGINLYKLCYNIMYSSYDNVEDIEDMGDVNVLDVIHILKGSIMIIDEDDWKSFMKLNIGQLSIDDILDFGKLDKLYSNTNYLIFDYSKTGEILKTRIIDLYLVYSTHKRGVTL